MSEMATACCGDEPISVEAGTIITGRPASWSCAFCQAGGIAGSAAVAGVRLGRHHERNHAYSKGHRPDCPHSAGFMSMLCVCWAAGAAPDSGSSTQESSPR